MGSPWQSQPAPVTSVLGDVPGAVVRCPRQMCPPNSWRQAGLFNSIHFPVSLGLICQADPVHKARGRRTPSWENDDTTALSLSIRFHQSLAPEGHFNCPGKSRKAPHTAVGLAVPRRVCTFVELTSLNHLRCVSSSLQRLKLCFTPQGNNGARHCPCQTHSTRYH